MASQLELTLPRRVPDNWHPDEPPDLSGVRDFTLDTETDGLRWFAGDRVVGVAVGWGQGADKRRVYLPVGHNGGNLDKEAVGRWGRALEGKTVTCLNGPFDAHNMRETFGVDFEAQGCRVRDVANWAALLDDQSRRGFGLEDLSQKYLKRGKVRGLDPTRMKHYHASEVAPYACNDVDLTDGLAEVLWPMIVAEELVRVADLEDDVIFATMEMERNASPLDVEKLERWVRQAEQQFLGGLSKLRTEFGVHVKSPDDREDMAKLFKARGIKVPTTAEGDLSELTDALLVRHVTDPAIALARRVRQLASLKSKYLDKYWRAVKRDGLLRYSLHQLRSDDGGTIAGRYSATGPAGGEGANPQQVLTEDKQVRDDFCPEFIIKELFVAGSGLYVEGDAKQVEYRIFAHYAAAPRILAAYARDPDTDFHDVVRELLEPYRPGLTRRPVKNLNFAKLYGAGGPKIAAMLGLEKTESDQFVALYDREFPEVKQLLRRATKAAETRGFVRTILGRRSRFPDDRWAYKALNRIVQGSAADINKMKILELYRRRREIGLTLRLTVHDSACGDVPDQAAADRMRQVLDEQAIALKVPILWSVKCGANWRECK